MIKFSAKHKIKALLYFLFYYTGLLHLFIMIFKRTRKEYSAVVLLYHRIIDDNTTEFLKKSDAIHHHIRDFEREIAFINKWLNIISIDDLISNIKNKKNFRTPSIAITFDDGYRDNCALAYPVLKRWDLPATIYVTTGLLESNKRTWLDEIEYILLNAKAIHLRFQDEVFDISTLEEKQRANIKIARILKYVESKQRLKLIDDLYNELKVNKKLAHNRDRIMLNWTEIKEMSKSNISFGAHTHSHPILSQMPLEEAKQEIAISKKILENELKIPIDHFAFPNGTEADFNEALKQFCIDMGFKSIVTAEYGTNDKTSDPYFIKRAVPYVPIYVFAVEIVRLFWKN